MATSSSSKDRPKTSGAEWTCVSMNPAIGLTAGGGGGNTRTCANTSLGHYRCKPSTTNDCDPTFEEGASRCRSTRGAAVVRAANMDSARYPRPATTLGEFPSWDIGPAHRSPPELLSSTGDKRASVHLKCDASRWQHDLPFDATETSAGPVFGTAHHRVRDLFCPRKGCLCHRSC